MELSTNLPSTEREFSEIDELIHQLEDEVCTLESKLKKAEKNSDKYRAEVVTEQQRSFERISQVRAEKSERFFLLFSLVVKLCESNALSHLEKELIRDFVLQGAEFFGNPPFDVPPWFFLWPPDPSTKVAPEQQPNSNDKPEAAELEDESLFEKIDRESHDEQHKLWQGQTLRLSDKHQRELREVYLRLARLIHPDRATNEETRARWTTLMKNINEAYKAGDAARLFQLEEELQEELMCQQQNWTSPFNAERISTAERLKQKIKLLKVQLDFTRRELRLLKKSDLGQIFTHRKQLKNDLGVSADEVMLDQIDEAMQISEHLTSIIDAFFQKRIGKKALSKQLRNCLGANQENAEMGDILEEALVQLFTEFATKEELGRRKKSSKHGRKR